MKKLFLLVIISAPFIYINSCAPAKSTASTSNETDSVAYWKKAIEANPNDIKLHQSYIKATNLSADELLPQYEIWMKQFPDAYNIPLAIGTVYYGRENPKAKPYLLQSVNINPQQAKVYQMLSVDAERWGDGEAANNYMKLAAETDPEDPSYAFYYAMDFEHSDPALWRKSIYELAKKFPDSERGAQGLYWLATRSTDKAEKLQVYELLRKSYDPAKYSWSSSGMTALYTIYLGTNPAKAVELAAPLKELRDWKGRDTLATTVVNIENALKNNDTKKAVAYLAELPKTNRYWGTADFLESLIARVKDADGDTKGAYDNLVSKYAKIPGDELKAEVVHYGSKLGKSLAQIDADIWKLRNEGAKPAPDFTLGMYTKNTDSSSLTDYRGKVVLLTFWFPGCGPCRGEFPHFEAVLSKFNRAEVAYVGINVYPEQDDYVVPFMEGTKYTFTPLKATAKWAQDVYKVRGQPTNFLIDKEGRIVFSNFRTESNNHRELELMIEALLH